MRIAVDVSSILWTCLKTGKSADAIQVEHNGKTKFVNSAAHGYEFAVDSVNACLRSMQCVPRDLILVEEGLNSKRRRLNIDSGYKARSAQDKCEEEYTQFQALRTMFMDAYLGVGAIRVTQEGVEGDDVIGWLAENTEEDLVIHTFDNDLLVLHGTNKYGASVQVRIRGEIGINKYGPFDHKLITTYKALVGDSSDSVKGCPGFGKESFPKLFGAYGADGVAELQALLEAGDLSALTPLHGKCQFITKILDNEAQVLRCYQLVKIHPEWVNTVDSQLVWQGGMVTDKVADKRLHQFRQQKVLVTTDNLVEVYNFLKSKLAETPDFPFDIETSSGEESDDWMEARGTPDGVDVLGHRLTGFSLTFGRNHQYTLYVSVNHADTKNIEIEDARLLLELPFSTGKEIVIQNTSFEGVVLAGEADNGKTWMQHWENNGYRGFIPNWRDTVFEASYVNENIRLGLKERSKIHLGYTQATFEETTTLTGWVRTPAETELTDSESVESYPVLPRGGRTRQILQAGSAGEPLLVTKSYKMCELSAAHVFDYGCDDTICTSALSNLYKLVMQLEHTWEVYKKVEIAASYQHAKNFLDGKAFSLETMRQQEAADTVIYDSSWEIVKNYLTEQGWEGTVPPNYGTDISAKQIKEAYKIWHQVDASDDDDDGEVDGVEEVPQVKDPILSSRVRTPAKFLPLLVEAGADPIFVEGLKAAMQEPDSAVAFTNMIRSRFTGEPLFKVSPKQMHRLLYETMGLPIRVYNKPTPKQRKAGVRQGSAKTDALAVKYALRDASEAQQKVLNAVSLLQMVKTRRGLYYEPYPYFIHWKTGKIHSTHRQCHTNTRRAAVAEPNDQQMPKHVKIKGQEAKFRRCIVPHKKGAVVVSLDFVQQELVFIAEESQDPNMLSCYQGDNLKDMHILTALGIVKRQRPELNWSYEAFQAAVADESHELHPYAKEMRSKGKTTNFATEYGAMAEKLAMTMLIDVQEAQDYIDAREETFARVVEWKQELIAFARKHGYIRSRMGAVRHLAALLNSDDRWEASKAERQAVNYRVQGSCAEQTKLAEGLMWQAGLSYKYDAAIYGPIHDEVVASVMLDQALPFLAEMHKCMTTCYAGMGLPNRSSISIGLNFGDQIEVGEDPAGEKVKRAVEELRALI